MARARHLLFLFAAGATALSYGQCTNNNTLTGAAVTPTCPGTTNIPCVQGGQYALINVVSGNTYTFSTCGASFDTQITLFNNTGGGSLGYNDDACGLQSTVNWTANYTGQLRVLVDLYNCATNAVCAPLAITCTSPPVGDCVYTLTLFDAFSDGWGTSFVGISIAGGPFQNYTLPNGQPSLSIQFGVNIGAVVVLNYNASGTWQTDNSYILTLGGSTLFNSGSPPLAGAVYGAAVTCVPPPPPPEDCIGAVTICSNVSFGNNTTNTGSVADISAANSGCLDFVEYQGTWYIFSPSVGGNLGFTIAPLGPDDYDWGVWGPYPPGTTLNTMCPPLGPPIRCAASSGPATFASTGSYATGMGHATFSPPQFAPTATPYGIPATFDACPLVAPQRCGWVPGMQVTVGQVYLMYISNWSQSSTGFSLNWNLQSGASLDCTILPIELIDFQAFPVGDKVELQWSTASETNSDRFVVERSKDGAVFEPIGMVTAAGNSAQMNQYAHLDRSPYPGLNYYRLQQVDLDGTFEHSAVRTVRFWDPGAGVSLVPNPGSGLVDVLLPSLEAGSTLMLLDATGRVVQRMILDSERASFDSSSLVRGVYAFRVIAPSGASLAQGTWVRE
ncbi:MAG: T9SS type A sorting domain-containing protein [Flavobacteriales bacterium]|nr:T9SS type A sorting domain-containing protein [Flavobacteriales bacterium]